jgi:hypothetical protein
MFICYNGEYILVRILMGLIVGVTSGGLSSFIVPWTDNKSYVGSSTPAEVKKCPKCGREMRKKFCTECGTKLKMGRRKYYGGFFMHKLRQRNIL